MNGFLSNSSYLPRAIVILVCPVDGPVKGSNVPNTMDGTYSYCVKESVKIIEKEVYNNEAKY